MIIEQKFDRRGARYWLAEKRIDGRLMLAEASTRNAAAKSLAVLVISPNTASKRIRAANAA